MAKVTVIMPSLNVVKYIKPCIESVLAQTLDDLEILCVDAGSSDGTLEILEGYAEHDNRVKVIHSDRRSYGYQLNMGIGMASGEYVAVVETDDMIMPDMLKILYEEAVKSEADYVKGSAELIMEISKDICLNVAVAPVFRDINTYYKQICPQNMPELVLNDCYLWTGIYRNGFIKQIILNETPGAAYQDAGFMFQVYAKAKRAVYLPDAFYLYRQDNAGASSYDRRAFEYFVKEYDYMKKFLPDLSQDWHEAYYIRMLNHCRRRFQVMGASCEFWQDAMPAMEELRSRLMMATEQGIVTKGHLDDDQRMRLKLYLDSPQAVYGSYAASYYRNVENIHEMWEIIRNKQAVIFGGGKVGRFLHALVEHKFEGIVQCYCDNKESVQDSSVQGIPVIQPGKAADQYPEAVYLISSVRYENEMRMQLKQLGILEDNIFTYKAGMGDFLFFTV